MGVAGGAPCEVRRGNGNAQGALETGPGAKIFDELPDGIRVASFPRAVFMLADNFAEFLLTDTYRTAQPAMREAIATVGGVVQRVPRFSLDRSATLMVETVSVQDAAAFAATLPLCRLPYPSMWVEIAFRDRLDFVLEQQRKGLQLSTHELSSHPQRLGFLMTQTEDTIVVQVAWTHSAPVVEISAKVLAITLSHVDVHPSVREKLVRDHMRSEPHSTKEEALGWAEIAARVQHVVPPWLQDFWDHVRRAGPHAVAEIERVAEYDLAAEWRFVMALLIVLNSRNVISYGEESDVSKINKVRAKKGKPPMLAQREITLNLTPGLKRRIMATAVGRSDANPHLVRGHFKVRKTGIFWWSPHGRGQGRIENPSYRVSASKFSEPARPGAK